MRKRWKIGLGAAAALVIGFAIARRHELVRFALQASAGLASGYSVRIGDQRIGGDRLALFDIRVIPQRNSAASRPPRRRPLLAARPVAGQHASFWSGRDRHCRRQSHDREVPRRTYNFHRARKALGLPPPPQPARVSTVPIRFTLRMHDASLELREPAAYDPSAKAIAIAGFHRGRVDRHAPDEPITTRGERSSAGRVRSRLRSWARSTPFGVTRMHRARAARFPLRALANYFAYSPIVRITQGRRAKLRRAPVFARRAAQRRTQPITPTSSSTSTAAAWGSRRSTRRWKTSAGGCNSSTTSCFLRHMHASLAGIPLHLAGGISDLAGDLTGRPQLRLGVYGTGDLARLRRAFAFTRNEPISGAIGWACSSKGRSKTRLIVARATARAHDLSPAAVRLARCRRRLSRQRRIALAAARVLRRYGGRHPRHDDDRKARAVRLGLCTSSARPTGCRISTKCSAGSRCWSTPTASGTDMNFTVSGAAASARGVARVAALIALDPNGTAAVEPFWLHTERGDFDGGYLLDRPHDTSGFWGLAGNLRMRAPTYKAFPGLDLPAIPKINGRIVSVAIAGGGSGKNVVLAGLVSGDDADIAGVKFDRVVGAVSAERSSMRRSVCCTHPARGGSSTVTARFRRRRSLPPGSYRGTLEGLQPFLGSAIPGHGRDFGARGGRGRGQSHHRAKLESHDARSDAARRSGLPARASRSASKVTACASTRRTRSRPAATSSRLGRSRSRAARKDRRGALIAGGQAVWRRTAARHRSAARRRTLVGERQSRGGRAVAVVRRWRNDRARPHAAFRILGWR